MRSIKREIIEIICVTLFATAVTLSLWRSPVIVTALLIVGSLCMFILWSSKGDIIAYITAFLIGFFADYMCTKGNFYSFNAANMMKLPSWAPICWGYIYVLFRRGALTLDRILTEGGLLQDDRLKKVLGWIIKIAILLYFWKTVTEINRHLSATLSVALIVIAFFWNTKMDLYAFLISAIGGVVAEAAAIHLGIWTYPGYFFTRPFKLPISIPIIYGVVGVIVYRASTIELTPSSHEKK